MYDAPLRPFMLLVYPVCSQDKSQVAFQKYIDGMLDLMLLPHKEVVDHMGGKADIIFCGPDENTADLMDWACTYARSRVRFLSLMYCVEATCVIDVLRGGYMCRRCTAWRPVSLHVSSLRLVRLCLHIPFAFRR